MKKIFSIATITVLLVCLVLGTIGCGGEQPAQTNPEDRANPADNANEPEARTMVDCANRTVTLPEKIDKAFCTTPIATTMLYILAPEKLAGWNYELSPITKRFLPAEYAQLPNLGGWYMNNTCNIEELLKYDIDMIFVSSPTDPDMCDEISTKTGKPTFYINYPVKESGTFFKTMGTILGLEERALELADYCDRTVREIGEKAATIPQDNLVTVYYAEGTDGLMTDPKGTIVSEVLDYVGGLNVADIPFKGGGGLSPVTLEQILKWDAEVIITWSVNGEDPGFLVKYIMDNNDWQNLRAVKTKRVYEAPANAPFSFFGRLPAANQIIGFKWAGQLLYPEIYDYNINEEIKEFYQLFYHMDLTEEQLDEILDFADDRYR